jgi:hypothetical protein
LWGVNWRTAWPVLRNGAWVVVVLVIITVAMVWAQLEPASCTFLGIEWPNFWWQLAAVSLLAGLTLFCGWLQGVMNWAPAEIDLEPPAHASAGHHQHAGH